MASEKNKTNQQVYNIREDEKLIDRISSVICVMMRRGMWVAGYDNTRELQTIHYNGYNANKPVWELDFFEALVANEPLLMAKEKIAGVFICSERNMVVPEELYNEDETKNWLKQIHLIEPQDEILIQQIKGSNARYMMAVPMNITELIRINFKKASILPLPAYQFAGPQFATAAKCCISNEQTCATLYQNGQLLWHSIFDYAGAEDIAHKIQQCCNEHNIDPTGINVTIDAISAAEFDIANTLAQLFGMQKGNEKSAVARWQPAVSLAQQLIACV